MLVEILPEGGGMESLDELALAEHAEDSLGREEVDGDVLSALEVLRGEGLHIGGEERIDEVVHGAGVLGEDGILAPLTAAVAGLLHELTLGSGHRRGIAGIHDAGAELVTGDAQGMAILTHHDEVALPSEGDDVDPGGVFEDVVLGTLIATGQAGVVEPYGEPGTTAQILGREDLPLAVVIAGEGFGDVEHGEIKN